MDGYFGGRRFEGEGGRKRMIGEVELVRTLNCL